MISVSSPATTLAFIPTLEPVLASGGLKLVVMTLPSDTEAGRQRVAQLIRECAGIICCPTVYSAVSASIANQRPVIVLWKDAGKAMLTSLGIATVTVSQPKPPPPAEELLSSPALSLPNGQVVELPSKPPMQAPTPASPPPEAPPPAGITPDEPLPPSPEPEIVLPVLEAEIADPPVSIPIIETPTPVSAPDPVSKPIPLEGADPSAPPAPEQVNTEPTPSVPAPPPVFEESPPISTTTQQPVNSVTVPSPVFIPEPVIPAPPPPPEAPTPVPPP